MAERLTARTKLTRAALEKRVVRAAMRWYHCWTHKEDSYFDREQNDRNARLENACKALKERAK